LYTQRGCQKIDHHGESYNGNNREHKEKENPKQYRKMNGERRGMANRELTEEDMETGTWGET
jgi:hypothetical protein